MNRLTNFGLKILTGYFLLLSIWPAYAQHDETLVMPSKGKLFDPVSAKYKQITQNGLSLDVGRVGEQLKIRVSESGTAKYEVLLAVEIVQLQEIRVGSQHIIAVGWMNGALASSAVILDRANGKTVDNFLGYRMAVSPDARYIAFHKFYPAHGLESVDTQYRIYDATLSPVENRIPYRTVRPGDISLDKLIDVGAVIFPLKPGELDQDPADTEPSLLHWPGSSFFWAKNSLRVAFVDLQEQTARLVVTDFPLSDSVSTSTFVKTLEEMGKICTAVSLSGSCNRIVTDHVSLKHGGSKIDLAWKTADDATPKHTSVFISKMKKAPR